MEGNQVSKLLIDDYPIQVLPTLAKEIGLNEAIVLQQMHYWLNMSKHDYDDKKWIYNSYTKWVLQFPFWSESTVKRAIGSLEKQNLLFIGNYNKAGFDKTKWYSINYGELNKRVTRPSGQNDPTIGSKWTDDEFNLNRPIPETTTENTTETKNTTSRNSTRTPYKEIIDYLNEKTGRNYKHTAKANQRVIKARMNEGYTLEDFKTVIDKKYDEWNNDTKMKKFLRPETLFSTNFDRYLNEETESNQKSWAGSDF